MNINLLIKKIKEHIGISQYLKTSYDDFKIYDIIITHALKDWNYYFKYEFEPGPIALGRELVKGPDLIALPNYVVEAAKRSELMIEDIKKFRFSSTDAIAMRGNAYGLYASHHGTLDMTTQARLMSLASRQGDYDAYNSYRYMCKFEKPNSLRFTFNVAERYYKHIKCTREYPTGVPNMANISFFLSQSKNLLGITPGRENVFFELAKLHVMRVIYENETKYLENIMTGAGTLNLKIEEWAQSGERIKELHEKMYEWSKSSKPSAVMI